VKDKGGKLPEGSVLVCEAARPMKRKARLLRFDDESCAHFVTTRTCRSCPYFGDEKCCQTLVEQEEVAIG
jgi:hypothetical protein